MRRLLAAVAALALLAACDGRPANREPAPDCQTSYETACEAK